MARLQDFNTVTPTNNDKLLIVQSQGQGLATLGNVLAGYCKQTVTSPIAAGATFDYSNFSDGAVIFIYRPQDAQQSDYTGIYIRATNWSRLIPVKAVQNVTINGYILTNGTSSALRCVVLST
jgi:hypothetical protein